MIVRRAGGRMDGSGLGVRDGEGCAAAVVSGFDGEDGSGSGVRVRVSQVVMFTVGT